ncbi:MAG: ribosome recycling factor [Chlamydiae bacterium SM23_39]|nr:MAG: ribosome recycling factor [Chlamydiae bacterium SM23_39]
MIANEIKNDMQIAVDHFKKEISTIRTNRANPAMVEGIFVEVYGTKMRLKDLANITIPESRQLLITPFDINNIKIIAKAIEQANLNLQPKIETNSIRINIPPMDETIRKEMAKKCKKYGEDAKIAVREVRRKYNEILKKQKVKGELSEDMLRKEEKSIQDFTNRFCNEIDKIIVNKEKELLAI